MQRVKRGHSTETVAPPASSLIMFYWHRCSEFDLRTHSVYKLNIAPETNGDTDTDTMKPLPEPLFRLSAKNFPDALGYAALGSKIYLIGGMNAPEAREDDPSLELYSLDTYIFDTTKPIPNPDDPKCFLIKGPQLIAPKAGPISVVFDGKIYVFPIYFSGHNICSSPKCEVLDPRSQSWRALPDPPSLDHLDLFVKDGHPGNYHVEAYAICDGTFVASTPKGIFCLDLKNPTEWKHFQHFGGVSQLPFTGEAICIDEKYFAIVKNRKHLLCQYDFTPKKGLTEEKDSLDLRPGHQKILFSLDYAMVHLVDNRLCVIRSGLDLPPGMTPTHECSYLITCEIIQVNGDQQQKKKIKKKNRSTLVHLASSTFIMDVNPGTPRFPFSPGYPVACFPMMDKAD